METIAVKVVAGVVALLLVVGGIAGAKYAYDRYKALAAQVAAQKGVGEATSEVTSELGDATAGQGVVERHYTERVIEYRERMREAANEDATVANARSTPIPLRMRQLACEQRVARDGSGDPAAGCAHLSEGAQPDR